MVAFFFFFKQKTAYEMLRSLVGSEMCIRDRRPSPARRRSRHLGRRRADHAAAPDVTGLEGALHRLAVGRGCASRPDVAVDQTASAGTAAKRLRYATTMAAANASNVGG